MAKGLLNAFVSKSIALLMGLVSRQDNSINRLGCTIWSINCSQLFYLNIKSINIGFKITKLIKYDCIKFKLLECLSKV